MTQLFALLMAQQSTGGGVMSSLFGILCFLIYIALVVLVIAGFWQVFTKAGKPGWAAIIPIYNGIVLLEIAGKPIWWIILFFIPIVNLVIAILVSIEVAKRFGKDELYGVGLALLPFIFYPMLGFSDARYRGGPAS